MKTKDNQKNQKSTEKTTKRSKKQAKKTPAKLDVTNPDAAGIDIGSEEHWVCVPENRCENNTRPFNCYTPDLHKIKNWLKECNIKTVAMESTGVYWIPLYQLLEKAGFDVCLVNTKHMKNVQGRPKTDRLDCEWLMRLHSYGLLAKSFRPADDICVLRTLMRWHETIVRESSDYIRRMGKALQQMNVRLDKAVNDITGVTGTRIIESIISGCSNPRELAEMRNNCCKKSVEEIEKALSGDYRKEHIYVLESAYEFYKYHQKKRAECEAEIEKHLKKLTPSETSMKAAYKKLYDMTNGEIDLNDQKREEVLDTLFPNRFDDMRSYLASLLGVDTTAIPGIDVDSTQGVISEIGLDFTAWPNDKHFVSWMGLATCVNKSGISKRNQHTAKVQSKVARIFRMAAVSAGKSKDSYLGQFYRRKKSQIGAPKAITATARKIATIFYLMVTRGTEYQDLGKDYQHNYCTEKYLKKLGKNLKGYGFKIVPIENNDEEESA